MSPLELLKTLEIMSRLEEEQSSQYFISGVFTISSPIQGYPSVYQILKIKYIINVIIYQQN